MLTKYKRAQPQKSTSTPRTDEHPEYSYGHHQRPINADERLPIFHRTENTQTSTIYTPRRSPHIGAVNSNDPQLLAEILKPTVEALAELGMAQVMRTATGKLIVVLSSQFDDDLKLT